MTDELDSATEVVTLDSMLDALGSAVVSLRVAPAGTQWPIRTVALFDADDLAAAADSGVLVADLCVLAGVPAATAQSWISSAGRGEGSGAAGGAGDQGRQR